jgi:hypothetical protein
MDKKPILPNLLPDAGLQSQACRIPAAECCDPQPERQPAPKNYFAREIVKGTGGLIP